jgi:hypothetical protein
MICSVVKAFKSLMTEREINRQRPPLDPVADDVGDSVAHRPQVMDHRPAYRDGQFRHDLPGPRLQHCLSGSASAR